MQRIKTQLDAYAIGAGKLRSVLIGQPEDLQSICYLLNSQEPQELCSELRSLVKVWHKSGPNLAKMLKDDGVLDARVKHGRTILVPTRTGKGHLLWLPAPRDVNPLSWKDQALSHFMDLIVNPQWHKLGGPCERCGKYYVKKTARQKVYCSRRCGSANTAMASTRRKREEQRADKMRRAQAAADNWAKVRTRQPWKWWVSVQTKITVKWLTRAVNRGDLRVPGPE
jgi:hypothetical protein